MPFGKHIAHLQQVLDGIDGWEASWDAYEVHSSLRLAPERVKEAVQAYVERLGGNYPFFHPRYAGQMLKPPHPLAVIGYLGAMMINPNNHALDGGPPTAAMEKEVVAALAAMFGFPATTLGHLTSGGTVANLEALWVARRLHPNKAVAFSTEAHYTHHRMGEVVGLETIAVPADRRGRMDLDALEAALKAGTIGTVVLTTGTTALGAVDPVKAVLGLRDRYDFRIHVDAAYGGFYRLLADDPEGLLDAETSANFQAIASCDSVAIDPHKHGLQPYGCGCVLFQDASVGRFYRHESSYTYFTSDDLHLGEISLECSRAGAAAGAFWLTLQLLPLAADHGLGPVLKACRGAARTFKALAEGEDVFQMYVAPELDIVTYYPTGYVPDLCALDGASQAVFEQSMAHTEGPVYLSVLKVPEGRLATRASTPAMASGQVRILRSVLMKPEHADWVPRLYDQLKAFLPSGPIKGGPM